MKWSHVQTAQSAILWAQSNGLRNGPKFLKSIELPPEARLVVRAVPRYQLRHWWPDRGAPRQLGPWQALPRGRRKVRNTVKVKGRQETQKS